MYSQPGRGARFTLIFPSPLFFVAHPNPSENAQEISISKKTGVSNKREAFQNQRQLLIVEDNPAMQQLLALQLSEKYQLGTALNGREGLKKAQNGLPN